MNTVADLTRYIESRFPVGEPTQRALSVTGEPYVVIGHEDSDKPLVPGVIREGETRGDIGWCEDEVVGAVHAAFDRYAEDKSGTLYWRVKPALEWYDGRCIVYMRLLISDKAVLPATLRGRIVPGPDGIRYELQA